MNELRFFNPYADIRQTENRLPHWQQEGAVYFVTFHLADAVPARLLAQWEDDRNAWLRVHPEPWSNEVEREYHQRFSGAIERWLDAGHGACLLRKRECAQIVMEALNHFEGERVVMISSVVMPNHVHALFVQNPGWPLEKIVQSWKRFTARQINMLCDRSGSLCNEITSIVSSATRTTSRTACAMSAAIQRKRIWARMSPSSTKAK